MAYRQRARPRGGCGARGRGDPRRGVDPWRHRGDAASRLRVALVSACVTSWGRGAASHRAGPRARRPAADRRGSAAARLSAPDRRRDAAALPARADDAAQRHRRRCRVRPQDPEAGDRRRLSLGRAPPSQAVAPPHPPRSPRPRRPLSSWQLFRTFPDNAVAACDEELFEELLVERRFFWGRLFVVSDPDAIHRILVENVDNYIRIPPVRRAFTFTSGGGMNHLEGEEWWRHRRTINPALDYRALLPDVPELIRLSEDMAAHLAALPPGQEFPIGRTLTHLLTRTTGRVFAGEDRRIDKLLLRLGRFPENYGMLDVLPLPRSLYFIDRYRRARAGLGEYYALLDELFAERRSATYARGKDLLWRMATARDRETGRELGAAELRDEVLTLAAGAQAPLRAMTWGWYLLAQFPAAEERLHAELDAVLGARSPTPEDFPRLVYLRRFIDETMRLYPPLPVMLRTAVAAHTA